MKGKDMDGGKVGLAKLFCLPKKFVLPNEYCCSFILMIVSSTLQGDRMKGGNGKKGGKGEEGGILYPPT